MHDKRQFTIIVQKMLLAVWEHFIAADNECQQADQQDLEEMERMMSNALFEAQLDDDYDPFDDDHAERGPPIAKPKDIPTLEPSQNATRALSNDL